MSGQRGSAPDSVGEGTTSPRRPHVQRVCLAILPSRKPARLFSSAHPLDIQIETRSHHGATKSLFVKGLRSNALDLRPTKSYIKESRCTPQASPLTYGMGLAEADPEDMT